ncbi:uncharacterized protein B0H18DRAFT_1128539 [Fomitopsis serialis]|uniref:uncharacterized protein n=1 Tax=Fomitopsis serialis TaxID=139415 RepID=UPI002008844E|nr:uncharacterized protein B0H18DRAFT_1128539 [Neoantrodia serialis]KAH9911554.1 hypothetical protein B0H18DRAFT_1128539 [Neoantrodia serialis]
MGGSSPFTSPLSPTIGLDRRCMGFNRDTSVHHSNHCEEPFAFLSEPGFASDFPITDEEVESVVDGLYHDVGSQPPTASGSEAPVSSHGVRSTRKAVSRAKGRELRARTKQRSANPTSITDVAPGQATSTVPFGYEVRQRQPAASSSRITWEGLAIQERGMGRISPSNTRGPMPPLVTNAYVGPFVGADPSIAFLPLPFDIPVVDEPRVANRQGYETFRTHSVSHFGRALYARCSPHHQLDSGFDGIPNETSDTRPSAAAGSGRKCRWSAGGEEDEDARPCPAPYVPQPLGGLFILWDSRSRRSSL